MPEFTTEASRPRGGQARAFRDAVRGLERRLTAGPQSGQTPVSRSESIAAVYGVVSSPCVASQASE